MTNEELITGLKHIAHTMEKNGHSYYQHVAENAIKALEQGDVLEKIRAEIERRKKNSGGDPSRDLAFNVCLQIIDKYKAESEDAE